MEDIFSKVASQLILLIVGSVSTGVIWLIKSVIQAQKDVDAAHVKIRCLIEKLEDKK